MAGPTLRPADGIAGQSDPSVNGITDGADADRPDADHADADRPDADRPDADHADAGRAAVLPDVALKKVSIRLGRVSEMAAARLAQLLDTSDENPSDPVPNEATRGVMSSPRLRPTRRPCPPPPPELRRLQLLTPQNVAYLLCRVLQKHRQRPRHLRRRPTIPRRELRTPPPCPGLRPELRRLQTLTPTQRGVSALPSVAEPPAAPMPVRPIERKDVAVLLERANSFLENGDLAAARVLLRRAADAKDAGAALMLGATYDPVVLRQFKTVGLVADVDMAKQWYLKARELGSEEATRRLEALAGVSR